MYPPESLATEKKKIPYRCRTLPVQKFQQPFLLQPLENFEETIHGEWKTDRHRGKISRAFAGLNAYMTQKKIQDQISLFFDSPSLNRRGRSILAGECGSTTT